MYFTFAILAQTGFPSPWQTLRNTLQWWTHTHTHTHSLTHTLTHTLLISCRNQGFLPDKLTLDLQPLTKTDDHTPSHTEVPPRHQFLCVLRCGEEESGGGVERGGVTEVRVTCAGKKDGQVTVAQAMLKVQWKRSPPTIVLPPSPPPPPLTRNCTPISLTGALY